MTAPVTSTEQAEILRQSLASEEREVDGPARFCNGVGILFSVLTWIAFGLAGVGGLVAFSETALWPAVVAAVGVGCSFVAVAALLSGFAVHLRQQRRIVVALERSADARSAGVV